MKKLQFMLLTFSLLLVVKSVGRAQSIVLNEIVSQNVGTIADEDGEFTDWLELYNGTPNPLNLAGFGISDDPADPFKWIFPVTNIQQSEHLVIFASGKNRSYGTTHFETIIDHGDNWKYFVGETEPPAGWSLLQFDDAAWLEGPSGFGYGDDDDQTLTDTTTSIYVRKIVQLENLDNITHFLLHVDYDDGFVAYINDLEIARKNVGEPWVRPAHDETAGQNHEAQVYQGLPPELFVFENFRDFIFEGPNIIALQVHNTSPQSSDLTLIPFLTLGLEIPPDDPNGLSDDLGSALPPLHTNFAINRQGETVVLTTPQGQIADIIDTGEIPTDISIGRVTDGEPNWALFALPTPGMPNEGEVFNGTTEPPVISPVGALFANPVNVTITAAPGATIYYSLDGSIPTSDHFTYTEPFVVNTSSVVRATAIVGNQLPSEVNTESYIINFVTDYPIISISTDPVNLWDEQTGIYVLGEDYNPNPPHRGANYWEDWERPIHLELFEPGGIGRFSMNAGVKIHGGWTRFFPQKSLSIFARPEYGDNSINYPIFPDLPFDEYQNMILRNSGSDWDHTMFRDMFMIDLVKDIDADFQWFRPSIVFLNGEYWGIHNIREKLNEHYLATHHNIDPDSIDRMEIWGNAIQGDAQHYNNMMDFIRNNDLSDPANYDHVRTLMEIDNFIDFNAVNIYYDNTDWPGNNNKFWRPKQEGGKWRWFLFDTDFGFGLHDSAGYAHNTLEMALDPNGIEWPNPAYATELFRNLMTNETFQTEFINRMANLMNFNWEPNHVRERLDFFANQIEPEIDRHLERWERDPVEWQEMVDELYYFNSRRRPEVRQHLIDYFELEGMYTLTMDVNDPNMGSLRVSNSAIEEFPWSGQYFTNLPLQITAQPNAGYRFVEWLGIESTEPSIFINPTFNLSLTAVFEVDDIENTNVVINEINYSPANDFETEDWIELYNNSENTLNISGWILSDSEITHRYILPANTQLLPDDYLVLCRDTLAFDNFFPNVHNRIGNFSFGFSGNGEVVKLFNQADQLIDSVEYGVTDPWPTAPAGNGPTLELIHPNLDNRRHWNWRASQDHGTPGEINGATVSVDETPEQVYEFAFYPNYPDPFNNITNISFQLPSTNHVVLSIYNIEGRLVETLVQQQLHAGNHRFIWDASGLGSGIYFLKLESGKFTQVRKSMLIK
ncbi:CotH kinase family protein [bacterium]|nr:CotH kinase family protein [bacterium]